MREAGFHQEIAVAARPLPHPRFSIYRNNVAAGLRTALAVRYPAVEALLGEQDFTSLAARFAARYLPVSAVLIGYGQELPDFLANDEMIRHLPFIAELAELESRWWQAYHAREAEALPPRAFALAAEELESARLVFHPSVSLFDSRWPAGEIWQALKRGEAVGSCKPDSTAILICRPEAEVLVQRIAPARAEFLRRLIDGACLAAAVEETLSANPDFDLATEFQALIAANLIIRIDRTL